MDTTDLAAIWVYLSASPLLGLVITLLAYSLAHRLYVLARYNPLLNPVVVAVAGLIIVLLLTNTPYETYFEGGQYIHFLLGPATVALAIPLHQQFSKLKQLWLPVAISLFAGVTVSAISTVLLARLLGASAQTQLSLAPKSVTAPVAMGISEQIGGLPSLTAALVVTTGILGATIGNKLFKQMGVTSAATKGIAMGVAAHGIGTAHALQESTEMGAFSGLAMALSAFATAAMVPWLVTLAPFF
ncbi:MAG: LrgB family protein [Phormidesmis sp.]